MVRYGLKILKSGKLATFSVMSNSNAEFCVGETYELNKFPSEDEPIWLVDTRAKAEYARHKSTKWYNAGYETPMHHFDPTDVKVVKVTLEIEPGESDGAAYDTRYYDLVMLAAKNGITVVEIYDSLVLYINSQGIMRLKDYTELEEALKRL